MYLTDSNAPHPAAPTAQNKCYLSQSLCGRQVIHGTCMYTIFLTTKQAKKQCIDRGKYKGCENTTLKKVFHKKSKLRRVLFRTYAT